MRCRYCGHGFAPVVDARSYTPGSPLTCPACRRPAHGDAATDAMLEKLAQLARFGLAAEDRPLLEPNVRKA